jgi:hypothetical protein
MEKVRPGWQGKGRKYEEGSLYENKGRQMTGRLLGPNPASFGAGSERREERRPRWTSHEAGRVSELLGDGPNTMR